MVHTVWRINEFIISLFLSPVCVGCINRINVSKNDGLHTLQHFLCKIAKGRKANLFQAPKILGTRKMKPKTNQSTRANAEITCGDKFATRQGRVSFSHSISFQYFAETRERQEKGKNEIGSVILTSNSRTPYMYPLRSLCRQTCS